MGLQGHVVIPVWRTRVGPRRMQLRPLRAWLWHDPFAIDRYLQDLSPHDHATARRPHFPCVIRAKQPYGKICYVFA
ncbi:hypothetical protein MBELCI_0369 [Limimaricola cinnabarinus LL-001]|uniref:Uncharacterized protein n=1 Tax=Limimaricola cinnabarinus LL-001 TaxID=1337093 RepID=U2YZU2_9RHOB|nr:hypothetical protein MBELCI_0369 [Limimaricola cinnabarinus LL-001]